MANYLEKKPFNEEMLICISNDKLTNKSIEMFTLIATEVSGNYSFRHSEDRQDAISSACHDFASYWRGYKWRPLFNMVLVRNFKDDEKIIIRIPNLVGDNKPHHEYTYTAKEKPTRKNDFLIGVTENKSIENLSNLINLDTTLTIYSTIHKVTKKITIIDKINEIGVYGNIEIYHRVNDQLVKQKKFDNTKNVITEDFYEPSPAFNWATSVAINGIIKSMDRIRPKEWRGGRLINFSELTNEEGEIFSF